MKKLCDESNICLNIHYYEYAILERVRLNEIIDYGIKIISEKPCQQDIDICHYYDNVHFIETINENLNLDQLNDTIEKIIHTKNKENHNLKELELVYKNQLENILNNLSNTS